MNVKVIKKPLNLIKNKKKPLSYSKSRKIHFKQRFFERVGYILTEEKYQEILNKVKNEGIFLYKKESDSGSTYSIKFNGHLMKLVYDPFKQELITTLGY